jgi:hypothetical protein
MVIKMDREVHKIFDSILKLIMLEYGNEFLLYIGIEKSIKQILHAESQPKKEDNYILISYANWMTAPY